jgi:hypothetical protein
MLLVVETGTHATTAGHEINLAIAKLLGTLGELAVALQEERPSP